MENGDKKRIVLILGFAVIICALVISYTVLI